MTKLNKPISRVTQHVLGGGFGIDKNRRLVITIIPSHGEKKGATFKLKPEKCRDGRAEYIAVEDVYRYAIMCRVTNERMAKLREIKKRKEDAAKDREARRGFRRQ